MIIVRTTTVVKFNFFHTELLYNTAKNLYHLQLWDAFSYYESGNLCLLKADAIITNV